jgi:hypothetical protein
MEKEKEVDQATGNEILEVVHLHVTTGEKKMVTIVDDVSMLSIVQPIEQLSEVEKVVPILIENLERQSWKKVKKVAVEGESELREETKKYCKDKGIEILKEKAGPAGIVCRSLLKKGEEVWKEGKMSKSFWGEAVLMASQIRNREGSTNSRSAWEKFDGSKPWKVEHAFGEKVEFSIGGDQGIFWDTQVKMGTRSRLCA